MPVAFPDIIPIGSVVSSMLTEAQFQAETSSGWVLADGRSVTGSRYAAITGSSTIPDLRGMYLRGKNNSRSDGKEDPAGEQSLGTYEADQNVTHSHELNAKTGTSAGSESIVTSWASVVTASRDKTTGSNSASTNGAPNTYPLTSQGGDDARPRSVVVNHFIRIN